LDENVQYSAKKLDDEVVNPSQIRAIIRMSGIGCPKMFPHRKEVPKTLIFAKTDSHADDIIQIVREVFDEENSFAAKSPTMPMTPSRCWRSSATITIPASLLRWT
jgi:type I restriction enzyme R subunit